MRRISTIIILIALFSISESYAGLYGTLKGKVVGSDGKGLVGAVVKIPALGKGTNVKNANGEFTLVNITAGTYEISVSYVGMTTRKYTKTFEPDKETKLDAKLEEDSKTTGEVIKYAEKNADDMKVGNEIKIDKKALTESATSNLSDVLLRQSSVVNGGNGYEIRNSRPSETQTRVDGIDASNQFGGGTGVTDLRHTSGISVEAIEQVQVLSGGFGAEYGEATGGIINTIAKTGNPDHYEGFLTYRTDLGSLNGSQRSGVVVNKVGTEYQAFEGGPGLKLLGANSNRIELGLGGPIPFLDRSTFYISANNFTEQFSNNGYNRIDSRGYNWGQLANNRSWVKNLTGRMKFKVTDNISLIAGGSYGITSQETGSPTWMYSNDVSNLKYSFNVRPDGGIDSVANAQYGVPEYIAKQNVVNSVTSNIMFRINHALTESSFYELTFSQQVNNDEVGRRIGNADPSFINGFQIYKPTDVMSQGQGKEGTTQVPLGKFDKKIDIYESFQNTRFSEDGLYQTNFQEKNPMTGYYEGPFQNTGTDNAFGLPSAFANHGNGGGYSFRYGKYFQVDGSYFNTFKDGELEHSIKAGFYFRKFTMELNSNSTPWDGRPTYDIYSSRYGGNLWLDADSLKSTTNKPKEPSQGAFYLEDRMKYKDITFSPGVRFEFFDPNSQYRTVTNRFVSLGDTGGTFAQATKKFYVAPRMNINYKITDKSNLRLNYGIYYKMPELQTLYDGANTLYLGQLGQTIGDPNMEPQRTNKYEVGYENQISDDYFITVAPYYSDVFKQLGVIFVANPPTPFWITKVAEYGTNKGIEFTIRKAPSNNYDYNINYTIARTTGTASNTSSNQNFLVDPYTDKYPLPLAEYVLDRDVTHRVRGTFNYTMPKDFGPELFGTHPFENLRFSITGSYRSGYPYTETQIGGSNFIGERNALRAPSVTNFDLRLAKSFKFSDYFGDDAKNSNIEFYLDVINLFNFTPPVSVYSGTSNPLDNGVQLERLIGNFNSFDYYKVGQAGRPESIASTQYDIYGKRIYSTESDYDHNGIVTQQETYRSYINYVQFSLQGKGNYQAPRQVYFGFNFRF